MIRRRALVISQVPRPRPKLFQPGRTIDGIGKIHEPRQHTRHISINQHRRLSKRKGPQRSHRVSTDPRQLQQLIGIRWKHPGMLFKYCFCRVAQHPHASIISQSFPRLEQGHIACFGQGIHIRKCLQKSRVITLAQHRRDLRLLQHHFRHQHRIRIACPPPRVIPRLLAKPLHQSIPETRAIIQGTRATRRLDHARFSFTRPSTSS